MKTGCVVKTKAEYVENLKQKISSNLGELYEAFGVDIDTLEKMVNEILLFMRVEEAEQQQKKK
jgi:hypothetical protein